MKSVGTGGSAGSTASAGNTGSTTLTAAQSGLPAHSHGGSTTSPIVSGIGSSYTGAISGNTSNACVWNEAKGSITINNNTAANASQGHTHTAGNPASYGVHVWKRTA